MARSGGKVSSRPGEGSAGTRQTILDAALTAFARTGYDGASMPGIARLAGVAPPLLHYYFESKENLWRQCVDHSLGELRAESAAVLRATLPLAPLDRLRALLQVHAGFAARCPDHFSMIVAEARADSGRFAWLQEHYTGPLFEEVLAILREAHGTGAIRDMPLKALATMLVGSILVHFTIDPARAGEPEGDEGSSSFVDFLFDLLRAGALA